MTELIQEIFSMDNVDIPTRLTETQERVQTDFFDGIELN